MPLACLHAGALRCATYHIMCIPYMVCQPDYWCGIIGIGRSLAAPLLPHHRTYGSRIRQFGGLSGQSSPRPSWVAPAPRRNARACSYSRSRAPAVQRFLIAIGHQFLVRLTSLQTNPIPMSHNRPTPARIGGP
jgi:hypothetical protein